jgi:transketolase
MATAMEYYKFADHVIGMTGFGESGPANELFEKFGFTKEQLSQNIANYLA